MTTNEPKLKPLELGPTGRQLAENVKRYRKRRSLSLRELSQCIEGVKLSPDAINKIEKQQRRANTDELTALAVALDVNVSALLLPLTDEESETVQITGGGTVSAKLAWDWVDGERPLRLRSDTDEQTQVDQFQVFARPPIRRMMRAGFLAMGKDAYRDMPDSKFFELLQSVLNAGRSDNSERVVVHPPEEEDE